MRGTHRVTEGKTTLSYPGKIKHIFLTFLQDFCSMQPPTSVMHWRQNEPEASNIWIVDSFAHNIETMVGSKPAIVFKRGPLHVAHGSLYQDLVRMESQDIGRVSTKGINVAAAKEYRSFMFSGNVEWQCISRQGIEAEEIATIVAMIHRIHQQVLWQKGVHALRAIQIGEESMIEGDVETEMIAVPVVVAFDIQAHYDYWEDGEVFERANLIGDVRGDTLLNTDP